MSRTCNPFKKLQAKTSGTVPNDCFGNPDYMHTAECAELCDHYTECKTAEGVHRLTNTWGLKGLP